MQFASEVNFSSRHRLARKKIEKKSFKNFGKDRTQKNKKKIYRERDFKINNKYRISRLLLNFSIFL